MVVWLVGPGEGRSGMVLMGVALILGEFDGILAASGNAYSLLLQSMSHVLIAR